MSFSFFLSSSTILFILSSNLFAQNSSISFSKTLITQNEQTNSSQPSGSPSIESQPSTTQPNTTPNAGQSKSLPTSSSPSESQGNVSQNKALQIAKEKEIEDWVRSAVDFVKQKGKTAAMIEFNKIDGTFTKENKYIFAFDYIGIMLASPNNPELVGKNQYDLQDSDGRYITREAIEKAKLGGGWIQYRWKNPENDKIECKKSFILPLPSEFLIGSGYYYPANSFNSC